MALTSGAGDTETVGLAPVGQEGDTCAQCGSVLATDQRYCVNCGWRRGGPRVDYETRIMPGAQPVPAGGPAQGGGASFTQSPIFAVGTIALLGIMLLLGVLIGKEDNGNTQTVAAQAAPTTTTSSTPTDTTATTASNNKAKGGAGAGKVEKGGSGSAAGVATVDTNALENAAQTGQGAQAGKNLPNQVATGGDQEATDPQGIKNAGGGSGSTCIGC